MLLLIAGLVLFLGTHAFTMARGPRAALIARVGEGPYKIGYSAVALLGLVLLGYGYGQYRAHGYTDLWSPPVWTRHLALLLVLLAFISFAAAYLPGRIKAKAKHPMLLGVKIWATAHLLANGDLGSIILFGAILAWAVMARISAKRRDEVTSHGGTAVASAGWRNDALAVVIGVAVWFVFARVLHPWLIGVAVWPGQA
ncbi:NnrU family protein [Methylobacterium aquaticum]|uniref:NnrU family protein n=1 Tax=Methylobacterium aquaticum TaxID=270351 RepID=A0A0J6S5E6_9HYPH|nr:NnrU family protein [Methylobacterium aquaticum]KMO28683.1 NnrU family protein [Methylobacterium aquaticum]